MSIVLSYAVLSADHITSLISVAEQRERLERSGDWGSLLSYFNHVNHVNRSINSDQTVVGFLEVQR